MICLDNTDTLEAGASVDAVVDYTVHGLINGVFTQIAAAQLSDTDPTVIYTAAAAVSIVSVILVNTHSAAVTVNLYLDPADGGNPRRMIPKDISLGIGYSLHFDGQRCTIVDASGNVQTMPGLHAARHLAAGADPITTMLTSTNVITDHRLLRGDGGVRGAQETPIIVNDNGQMTNPSQPAFSARLNNAEPNVTGDGTVWNSYDAINNWVEYRDQANTFNGDGIFTASVDGLYNFSLIIYLTDIAAAHTTGYIRLITSNRTIYLYAINPGELIVGSLSLPASCQVFMDANDTAYITLKLAGGTKVIDVYPHTSFTATLLC